MSDSIWQKLRQNLKSGTEIPNWTYLGRGRKETMTIVDISRNSIVISSPNAITNQKVPRKQFEAVWEVWSDYRKGRITRGVLTPITRFSKYIISIFKWLEDQEG